MFVSAIARCRLSFFYNGPEIPYWDAAQAGIVKQMLGRRLAQASSETCEVPPHLFKLPLTERHWPAEHARKAPTVSLVVV